MKKFALTLFFFGIIVWTNFSTVFAQVIRRDCFNIGGKCADSENPCTGEKIPGNFEECASRGEDGEAIAYWDCCKPSNTPIPKPSIDPGLDCSTSPKKNGCGCSNDNECISGRCDWYDLSKGNVCFEKIPDAGTGCNEPNDCLSGFCWGATCIANNKACTKQGGTCLTEGNDCVAGVEIPGNFEDCRSGSVYFKCCHNLPINYYEICKGIEKEQECLNCLGGLDKNGHEDTDLGGVGTWTALGCIPTGNIEVFAGWLVSNLIYVASGIAFFLLIYGAFRIITANGDAKNVQAGSEMITATVSGLLFIIFSAILLRLIGVDILKIPGLGK